MHLEFANRLGTLFLDTNRPKSPLKQLPTQDNCFAKAVALEIPSAIHHTPDHKFITLFLNCIFLRGTWCMGNSITSTRKTTSSGVGHSSLTFYTNLATSQHDYSTKQKYPKILCCLTMKRLFVLKLHTSSVFD